MKKNNYLIAASLIVASITKSQQVDYTVQTNNPYDIKNVAVHLDPFYVDGWGTNTTIGFGFRADMQLRKMLSFNMDFRTSYLDIMGREHEDELLPQPSKGLKKHYFIELGGQFTLLDFKKDRNLRVVLKSNTYGRTTITNYIMVPGTRRTMLQVRGGFMNYGSAFKASDGRDSMLLVSVNNADNKVKIGQFGTLTDGSPTYEAYSMMNITNLYAGLSIKMITNLILETNYERGGKKSNAHLYDLYADVTLAPVVAISNVSTVGGAEWELRPEAKKLVGWRAGLTYRSSSRSFLSYRMEVGSRPGFRGKSGFLGANNYLLVTLGWTIPFKISALNVGE